MLCGMPPWAIVLAAGFRAVLRTPRGDEVEFIVGITGPSVIERIVGSRGLLCCGASSGDSAGDSRGDSNGEVISSAEDSL